MNATVHAISARAHPRAPAESLTFPELPRSQLQAILNPIHQATGLSNEFYTEQRYFEFERDQILGKTWACVGFADDLTNTRIFLQHPCKSHPDSSQFFPSYPEIYQFIWLVYLTLDQKMDWPSLAPYLGLGFGHSTIQRAGFGFVTEIGVTIGAPKVQLSISDPLRNKLDIATGLPGANTTTDAEIERQRRELADDVSKIKVFPHMYIGVAYRF